jgi:HEAT repeat protein
VEPPPPLDPRVQQWMASFDTLGPPLMARVRDAASDKHYDGAITILAQVGAAFLEAGDYPAVIPILRLFKAQEREAASWPRARALSLAAALGLVLHRSRARAVVQALPDADLAHRDAAFELLCAFGPIVVPALAAQLLDTRAPNSVRKEIFAIIEGIGQPAGRALIATIARNARRWNRVLPLIRLVGAIGYREAEPVLADFLKHPEPALRSDTLLSLHGALGRESEPYLVEALDDGHTDVRQRAVSLLAVLGSDDPRFLGTIEALLLDALGAVESGEALVIAAVHAVQNLGNVTLPGGSAADELLSNLLRGTSGGVVTRVRGKPRPVQSTAVLVAACETLAVLGGDRALSALGHASRSAGPVLRQAATRALERLGGLAA